MVVGETNRVGEVRKRSYRMSRRRELIDTTRDRIVEATYALHREVGPAFATISAIAARAGVERHTVYRHFPDLVSLFSACTEHGMQTSGLPQPEDWLSIPEPMGRLRAALTAMYAYWHRNERLVANILRDMPVMPDLAQGAQPYQDHLARIWQSVLQPLFALEGERGEQVRALAGTALEFGTWQALTRRYGLSDEAAVQAMLAAVESAMGRPTGRPPADVKWTLRPRSSEDRARPS